ncbi:MAG: 3-amino-5-hydroxybenzoate synthase [Candidatus Hydrogenedentota bacterium]
MSIVANEKLALLGGDPVRPASKSWPKWPIFDDAERNRLYEVFESGDWWYGKHVKSFEAEYAAVQGGLYCVSCTSGTTALEIILQAAGIGAGDEVIVPPYTFYATASAVARVGATPVFVDVDHTWCLNPALIEAAITPRTKAIMPVHFGSSVCDVAAVQAVADKHGILFFEDACHSWGSQWQGKGTGTLGKAGVFSFQQSKNISAAEGGAIVTNDKDFADICRSMTNCGRWEGGVWYEHRHLGTNARLTEFQGAVLSGQLTRLVEQLHVRAKNATILTQALSQIEGITPQPGNPGMTRRAYHLYPLRIDEVAFGCSREKFCEACKAEGLPIGAGYPVPLYKQPFMKQVKGFDYSMVHCPVTEDLCYKSGMWFHHSILLTSESDMQDVIRIIQKVKDNVSELRS